MPIDEDMTGSLIKNQTHAVAYGICDDETVMEECLPTMPTPSASGGGHPPAAAFDLAQITSKTNRTRVSPELPASTLNSSGQMHAATAMQVRRLTPRECERLQGFPDDYTLVPHRGKPAADGPRYKALGNSMAVPCMAWIGQRIAMVEGLARTDEAAVTTGGDTITSSRERAT